MNFDAQDIRLQALLSKKEKLVQELDHEISNLREQIRERWRRMPLNTLKQATSAYKRKLFDIGLDEKYVTFAIPRELDCVVSLQDPDRTVKQEPKIKSWYNAATDVEWGWRDAGNRHEIDMRWMIGIACASQFNPIRQFQRREALKAAGRLL